MDQAPHLVTRVSDLIVESVERACPQCNFECLQARCVFVGEVCDRKL